MLPKKFKKKLISGLRNIQYAQWRSLGVGFFPSAGALPVRAIDLEALLVFTVLTAQSDMRLLESVLEWCIVNRKWVNGPRLKRLATLFMGPQNKGETGNTSYARKLIDWIRNEPPGTLAEKARSLPGLEHFQPRGILTDLRFSGAALIQLRLRALFGINARAEVLLYLLQHPSGNSNRIAGEIGYAQKNVYNILENWTRAGALLRIRKERESLYSLKNRERWLRLLELQEAPAPVNWIQVFSLLRNIHEILEETDDAYLLASRFRDISDDARDILATHSGLVLPDPDIHHGVAWFTPFATTILKALEKLGGA